MTRLTGRTRYRTAWFTRRLVLQVEVLVVYPGLPVVVQADPLKIADFSELEWRDAKVDDFAA
jgi:hypothetical protein